VLDAATSNERLSGAVWVSFLPDNAERTEKALELASERNVVALKSTFLLGGNPDPGTWDDETERLADKCFEVAAQNDLVFHFHTSPGGASDISNFVPLVERYGKQNKIHLVHFGGGVSGHIKLVPQFIEWVEQGYQVYTDTTWAVGFAPRWLLTEVERTGVGGDRILFASDEPWSDFWGEFWKVNGAPVSDELKERVFCGNFEQLYGSRVG
jgi:uncharacterized protein